MTIKVKCPECKQEFDERKVNEVDIEEDERGRDVMTFICPNGCGEVRSHRYGR